MEKCTLNGAIIRPRHGKSKMGLTISEISREMRSLFDSRFKAHGVSNARWIVLWALQEIGEPASQKRLANLVGIESPTMVRMLDRLEEDGFVRRIPSEQDRRVKLVELCDKSAPILEEMYATCSELEDELFSEISEEDLVYTHTVLLRIRDRVFDLNGKTCADVIDHVSDCRGRGTTS